MTEPARQVVVQARQEARELAHDYVSSEHLLLGLLAVRDGLAGRALASWGISLELVRGRVLQMVGRGGRDSPEVIPFTPRAKRILALAAEEALRLGRDHVGTEHILLAVVGEHEAVAAGILRELGVEPEQLRQTVIEMPSAGEARPPAEVRSGGLAEADDTTGTDGPRVTAGRSDVETYPSAQKLADAFGAPVFTPSWWPADTEEISYCLVRSSGGVYYEIGSVRREGVPICIVGHFEAALAGRSPRDWLLGEWSEPPELAHVRGLIGAVGIPRRFQAVIYDQGLQIQFIGYDTEDEIMSVVGSLRRTGAQ